MPRSNRQRPAAASRAWPLRPEGWVWPWWLERQVDPASPAWALADVGYHNRSGRDSTPLGLPDDDQRWDVDPAGMLSPAGGVWSIDWWIGAEDRWHLPSRETTVRQRLVGFAPVVETVIRIPGGDAVARCFAVPSSNATDGCVQVEVENSSAAPVAVGLVLRPFGPLGWGTLRHVWLRDGRLGVADHEVVRSDLRARQAVLGGGAVGDVAAVVTANAAADLKDGDVEDEGGWASAALIWPLPHRATLRAQILAPPVRDVTPAPADTSRRRRYKPSSSGRSSLPSAPDAPGVARSWTARVERVTRLELPPGPLATAIEVQRRRLLLASARPSAGNPTSDPGSPAGVAAPVWQASRVDSALVVAALATAGCREEAGGPLERWLDDQHHRGLLGDDTTETAATLWALGVWAGGGDDAGGLVSRAPIAVARAAEAVARRRTPREDVVAEVWEVAGLQAAARILVALEEHDAARRAGGWAASRRAELVHRLEAQHPSDGGAHLSDPAGNGGEDRRRENPGWTGLDAAGCAGLLAVHLGVLSAGHPVAAGARRAAGQTGGGVGAVSAGRPLLGLSPYLSLLVATSSVLAGEDPSPTLRWLLSVAGPTWTWPSLVDPTLGTGSYGLGDDPLASVGWWALGRAMIVDDAAQAGREGLVIPPRQAAPATLAICRWLPDEWLGQPVEVHGVPTVAGLLSWALRWHGKRPALLWELAGGVAPVSLRAPGLDPRWSTAAPRGEALLRGAGSDG